MNSSDTAVSDARTNDGQIGARVPMTTLALVDVVRYRHKRSEDFTRADAVREALDDWLRKYGLDPAA